MCRLSYELMQAIRVYPELNYQSLDLPFHFCCTESPSSDRVFKYRHNLKINEMKFDIQVGDTFKPRNDWITLGVEGNRRDGFFETSIIKNKIFRLPLYKTEEKYTLI